MAKQEITEEMKVHDAWYEAKPATVDELAAFVTKLLTGRWLHIDAPIRLLSFDKMLYPTQLDFFRGMSLDTFKWLQEAARKNLAEHGDAHPDVVLHWQKIIDGEVPFGYRIVGD